MSEINTITPVTTNDAPRAPARTRTKREPAKAKGVTFTSKEVTLSQVTHAVATARRIDATKAGKLVRSFLRSNHDALKNGKGDVPKWDALKSKDRADGNRYPAMSTKVANYVTRRMTSKAGA